MPAALRGRPLSHVEREVLDFLLRVDRPELASTLDALRDQIEIARVVARWECCPSVDLAVGSRQRELGDAEPIIEAQHRTEPYELILFATSDGDLRCLEVVHYADDSISEFPPVGGFAPPKMSS